MNDRLDDAQDAVAGVDVGGTKTALLIAGAATGAVLGARWQLAPDLSREQMRC